MVQVHLSSIQNKMSIGDDSTAADFLTANNVSQQKAEFNSISSGTIIPSRNVNDRSCCAFHTIMKFRNLSKSFKQLHNHILPIMKQFLA